MGQIYLKTPKVDNLEYREYLLKKREELVEFPPSTREIWAKTWLGNDKNYFYSYVARKKDGLNVGEVSYVFDTKEKMPMLSIFIESLYRRNYYGQEAIILLLDKCLLKEKFEVVGVKYPADNAILTQFFNKLGFKLYKKENDYLYARITKNDYQISNYIDNEGRISKMPSSTSVRYRLVEYVASKFMFGQLYSTRAVFKIISDYVPDNYIPFFKEKLIDLGYLVESNDKNKLERIK